MKQINLRLEDELKDAFLRFCRRQGLGPNEALLVIVRAWARAELIMEQLEAKKLDRAGALIELGHLLRDLQKISNLNGQFRKAVEAAGSHYGIRSEDLGL